MDKSSFAQFGIQGRAVFVRLSYTQAYSQLAVRILCGNILYYEVNYKPIYLTAVRLVACYYICRMIKYCLRIISWLTKYKVWLLYRETARAVDPLVTKLNIIVAVTPELPPGCVPKRVA